jgi:GDP-L-fucose synthase
MAQHTLSSVNIFELIPFAVFGPGEDWRIRFISNACCRDIFDLPIIIMKNVIFDFIYIDDLVKITEWFINNTPDQQRYNVCSLKRYDLLSLAQMIQDYSGKKKEIIVQEPGMGVEYSGDNSRLVKLINPRFTKMDDAIKAIYKWYLDNKVNIKEEELSFDSVKK